MNGIFRWFITWAVFAMVWAFSVPAAGQHHKAPENPPVNKRKITVEKPDLKHIQEETLNPRGKFYFPKLMAKYVRNDTTMTNEEYRYFYLGYMFQEDYDPYRTSPYSGITDELRLKSSHTKEEIDTIRKYAELTLRDNPFDLRQMSFLVHVLKEKRKDMSAKIWEYRLEHLLGAIKSTGTGEDAENAWYVIYPMHEYDMVQLLGYEAVDADFLEPGIDYLTVRPDAETERKLKDKVAQGFYFNVEVLQSQYEKKHPETLEDFDALQVFEDDSENTAEEQDVSNGENAIPADEVPAEEVGAPGEEIEDVDAAEGEDENEDEGDEEDDDDDEDSGNENTSSQRSSGEL